MKVEEKFQIIEATIKDVPLILSLIKELAEYEKLLHEVNATEDILIKNLFGPHPRAEAVILYSDDKPAGFALYFYNFSTFLGKPGIYLEDLYVRPEFRGKGFGKVLLKHMAKIAKQRDCGRVEWSVLDWNKTAIDFYKSLGAITMEGWSVNRVAGDALINLAKD